MGRKGREGREVKERLERLERCEEGRGMRVVVLWCYGGGLLCCVDGIE